MSKRGVLRLAVVVALVVLVGAGVATGLLGGSDAQKHVEVKRGDPVPTNINRADDYGADTLRAYLAAALRCDRGAMQRFSRPGESEALAAMGGACRAASLTGDVAQDQLDRRGRAQWHVTAVGGRLPDGLHLSLAQQNGSQWAIDAACALRSAC